MNGAGALGLIPVRGGALPAGAHEVAAESEGRVCLVGDGTTGALGDLVPRVESALLCEAGAFAPDRWSRALAETDEVASCDVLLLPASPDGRDLAPRMAAALDRPLVTGAIRTTAGTVTVTRYGAQANAELELRGPSVVTFEPGSRGFEPGPGPGRKNVRKLPVGTNDTTADADVLEVLPPDPASMDLAEAARILGGGAGLTGPGAFELLAAVASALGASAGATRVVTDTGLVPHERQIGTTGVSVSPRLYMAFGVSGAVQHTGGLGDPRHVVAVNLDASCPMMSMADLAIVSDARAVLDALAKRLGVGAPSGSAAEVPSNA